jgi:hypothetical protein
MYEHMDLQAWQHPKSQPSVSFDALYWCKLGLAHHHHEAWWVSAGNQADGLVPKEGIVIVCLTEASGQC